MRRGNAKRKLGPLTLFVLPVVLVKLAAITVFDVDQPAGAKAAMPVAAPETSYSPPVKRAWSSAEIAAAQYVQNLRSRPFGSTPMLYENSARVKSTPTSSRSQPVELAPVVNPRFMLQAVIASAGGNKAVINGTPYVLGERIRGTTWMVNDIDVRWRSVELRDSTTGNTIELSHDRSQSSD